MAGHSLLSSEKPINRSYFANIVSFYRTMLPSIDALRCFCAAAKTLHCRSAARAVALTPSAFGHRIRQLEDELGAQLFVRTTRSVRLSKAGLALAPVAERALALVEDCTRAIKADEGLPP